MNNWRALIIDDEPNARIELKRLLAEYEHIQVLGEAGSVSESLNSISLLKPNLLFLDIDLGAGTGFDLLERVENDFKIIFITAYDQYAIRAFEVNALDYLLKPVNPTRLSDTISRLGKGETNLAHHKLNLSDKLLIQSYRTARFVIVRSIESIEANGDYSIVYTSDGKMGSVHSTIARWMSKLPSETFCQVHRSHIINIDHVDFIRKRAKGGFELVTKYNKRVIPLSRNCSSHFINRFKIGE